MRDCKRCDIGCCLLQVADVAELGITESFKVKSQVVVSAAEAAEMILRVDMILKSAPRKRSEENYAC